MAGISIKISDGLDLSSLGQLKETFNGCNPRQLADLGLHIRTIQKHHSFLLQLPAEVRVAICTLFLQDALLCWTEDATQPWRIRTLVHKQMPVHHVLSQICLMRYKCAPLYAKWTKVEKYNAVR
ncbi:hypothetical protein LTR78_001157 [Recurvomyces mirabilis]|uniref:Uncharacterized protein n=1 Tax=Recurvomyces mirabilis TaxID=574656 RepID=A0AAE1C5B8_9PEZI|nr:hypothetical protein LTR78_001157 [Recurvomyces mirabilis]KAK5161133.1 hypothetical protein LTS14_000929 [Recurvomyces mirabilis]